jgi:hypothetical protein
MIKMRKICLVLTIIFSLSIATLTKSQPALEVEGIFKDNKTKPYALVNGRIVNEGEEVDGAKVIEVEDDSVRFEYEGNIIVKKIGEGGGIAKEKQKDAVGAYTTRMNEINQNKAREEKRENLESLQEEQESAEQCSEYSRNCDKYWEAARVYKSNKQYDEAIEALNKSIFYGEQAQRLVTDEADRTKIDSIIQSRRIELEEVEQVQKELRTSRKSQ